MAYREKGFLSLPKEVERAIRGAREGWEGGRRVYVADRGFDDGKVFRQVLALGEDWVVRVRGRRRLGDGRRLGEVAASLRLPYEGRMRVKVGGRYQEVAFRFGWEEVEVEGRRVTLVVSRAPGLGRRGEWWLLTSLRVEGREDAARVVGICRRRWEVERFFRFLKAGLGLEEFQVRGLRAIRKVVAVMLGLSVFVWEVERSGDGFREFLLRLGGKLGIASERDGPYLLLRGLVRLLNYQITHEFLEEEEKGSCG